MTTDDSQPQADLGLAFVDVITNGLGAMLVLFFVVVMVQGSLEWSAAAESPTLARKAAAEPFVLMAQSSVRLFDPASDKNVWQFDGYASDSVSQRRGANCDWGETHALFLAPRAPGPQARMQLLTLPSSTEIRLELHHGDRHETYTMPAPAEGGWITVWPWPGNGSGNGSTPGSGTP